MYGSYTLGEREKRRAEGFPRWGKHVLSLFPVEFTPQGSDAHLVSLLALLVRALIGLPCQHISSEFFTNHLFTVTAHPALGVAGSVLG